MRQLSLVLLELLLLAVTAPLQQCNAALAKDQLRDLGFSTKKAKGKRL